MNYERVIPRDLFNDANLLKCIGKLWIETEKYRDFEFFFEDNDFEINQNTDDGSTYISNIEILFKDEPLYFYRPLNSRSEWPLYVNRGDETFKVFDDSGKLSDEFLKSLNIER